MVIVRRYETERVCRYITGRLGVVIALVVVVESGLRIRVLAGEPQRTGGGSGLEGRISRGAPACCPCLPGDSAVGCQKFGGGADEIGDDGVEARVVVGLGAAVPLETWVHGPGVVFGLRDRPVTAWCEIPGGGGPSRGLFDERGAFPGEPCLRDDGAVAAEFLFGDAPAERVIAVTPSGAVRKQCLDQPVVGVPDIGPDALLTVEKAPRLAHHPALVVVFVAGAARSVEKGARVLALSGVLHAGSGTVGQVAESIVGILFGPVTGPDRGDTACGVQVEVAGAIDQVLDFGDVAIRAVGVGAVLQQSLGRLGARRHCLGGQAVVDVPALRQDDAVRDSSFDLSAGGIVSEGEASGF